MKIIEDAAGWIVGVWLASIITYGITKIISKFK